ncbi:MAG: Rrf2 family transcriptional regulator [Acidimicrobiia bacterium]|nr:Rrf2 family transcriptional regulator [Acidimicrobiia bacterium]MDH5289009.1 Rrf2 family transcriptional regulator [Acidimicrobiia bacterium]
MRLEVTRRSDLAVRALRALATAGDRLKGPELAEIVEATPGFLGQAMTPLVRAGWVRSDPGPTGGYSLAGPLDDLSVLAVVEAVEGPTDNGRCVLVDGPCAGLGTCALHEPWLRARMLLLAELDASPVIAPAPRTTTTAPSARGAGASAPPRTSTRTAGAGAAAGTTAGTETGTGLRRRGRGRP